MKSGARAVGVAESYTTAESTLAAAVVRRDRVVDDVAFDRCTVGGTDATDVVCRLLAGLCRPDVHVVLLAGIAPAWYNLLDISAIHDAVDRPVCAVSFEASEGLTPALHREFDGRALADRLEIYERQPPRRPVEVNDERVWVRAVGCSTRRADEFVRAFTPEGGRPEPLRVAQLAARAGDSLASDS